jgi:hemerythrin-like domain-containing protein
MTVTQTTRPEVTIVALDLYRDIHKGIRAVLFDATGEAGRIDPTDRDARSAVAGKVAGLVDLLVSHAEHEDEHIQPALERELPALAARIAGDHEVVEARMRDLRTWAGDALDATRAEQRDAVHRLYVELASFTGAYLEHQDVEERIVMPALEAAVGVEQVAAIHEAIVSSIPPDEMATSLAVMLPAMNVDDRAELLGGIRANAPTEAFQGIWGLATSVLSPTDLAAVGARLGVA